MSIKIKTMVEKIVFNEEQLFELKEALSQVGVNKLTVKQVKSMILDQRTKIMEDTIDLLHFYLEKRVKQPEIIPSEELSMLEARLTEREDLLEEIGRRLERIVGSNHDSLEASRPEMREFILKELDAIEIQSWLEVGALLDLKTGEITDAYKFLLWSVACVEKYYFYLFQENETSLPNKVKALKLPKKLEDDLLVMVHNRNINAHNIVKIPNAFLPIMKNGYLNLFKHFIHESLIPKISDKFQLQGNSEVLIAEIQKVIISQNSKFESSSLLKILLRN